MADLYVGILILAVVSAAFLALGARLGRRLPPRDVGLLIMFGVLILLAFEKFAWDKLWLARVLPFSNVVILGNWYPPLAAFLGGLAWQRLPGRALRRGLLIVPLLLLSWVGVGRIMVGSPPPLNDRWTRDVCRQTSNASCSAAAAATLLRTVGISSNETEMARLCLTRPDGTSMLGLYRGLKLKTHGTGWKPVPFSGMSLDELQQSMHGAVLLTVELEPGTKNAEHFQRWGWDVGSRHSVVIYGFLPQQSGRNRRPGNRPRALDAGRVSESLAWRSDSTGKEMTGNSPKSDKIAICLDRAGFHRHNPLEITGWT